MTNIIIYKLGVSLKDKLSNQPLSHTTKYKVYYCIQGSQIISLCMNESIDLVLFFTDNVDIDEKILIRKIKKSSSSTRVVLFTNKSYALQAWKMDLFHFDEQPITIDKIKRAFQKYQSSLLQNKNLALSLKLPDGVHKLPLKSIKYLAADGNYTFFYYSKDKSLLVSKKLKYFESISEKDSDIIRVNRSFIINLNAIEKLSEDKIYFFGDEKPLEISSRLSTAVKKLLLSS